MVDVDHGKLMVERTSRNKIEPMGCTRPLVDKNRSTTTFAMNICTMKGVTILEDRSNKKQYLQIDVAELDKQREKIEDMIDGLIAEQRAGQPTISLEVLEKKLRKQGKL